MIFLYLITVWWVSIIAFISLAYCVDNYAPKYREGVYGVYSDSISMGCLLMTLMGPLNFICYPLWLHYEREQTRMDEMIEELQS